MTSAATNSGRPLTNLPVLRLKGFTAKHLLAIESLELPRDGLSWGDQIPDVVLVGGVNGSGKTTLLDVLYDVVESFENAIAPKIRERLGPASRLSVDFEVGAAGQPSQVIHATIGSRSTIKVGSLPGESQAVAFAEAPGVEIRLTQDQAARLLVPIEGQGGFQSLLRRLQRSVQGTVLAVDADTLARLKRYQADYGSGGFQARLGPVLDALNEGLLRPDLSTEQFSVSRAYSEARNQLFNATARKADVLPRILYVPSERPGPFHPTDSRLPGALNRPRGFTWKWTPPIRWEDSLEALLYSLRWADLNDAQEGDATGRRFELLVAALNPFFEGRKTLRWQRGDLVVETQDGATHGIERLSSGERQTLLFACELLYMWTPGSLVLIDEPEQHMHDTWLAKLWQLLIATQRDRGGQLIVASQSNLLFRIAESGTKLILGNSAP